MNIELNDFQKEFILNEFFKDERFAGWKSIGTKLIESGGCIVAGRNRLWCGGVGNFIDVDDEPESFECSRFTFRMGEFLKSDLFNDALQNEIHKLRKQYEKLATEIGYLNNLNEKSFLNNFK